MSKPPTTTVYYNSACPVCDTGICSIKQRLKSEEINWIDVHQHPEVLQSLGLELEDVRERLHLVGNEGVLFIGFDALVETWSRLPRWGWMATPLRWPGIHSLGNFFYNKFARQLYRWNRRRGHW